MSCFIVSPDTIDRIISTIELQGGWARHAVQLPTAFLYDWNTLGRAMLGLNAEAYRERYGDRFANDNRDERDLPPWKGRCDARSEASAPARPKARPQHVQRQP